MLYGQTGSPQAVPSNLTTTINGNASTDLTNFLGSQSYDNSRPKAYLNWMVVDEEFNAVTSPNHMGSVQVPLITGSAIKQQLIGPANMVVRRNGYLYVYVSNESNQFVYFDNLTIQHRRGPVVEQHDYYAFGLEIPGLSTQANKYQYNPDRYKYNGKELQANEFSDGSGLTWDDYGARMYDPQIGRWFCPDPLADKSRRWSPYNYAVDNPIRYIDPDGREIINIKSGVRFTGQDAQIAFTVIKKQAESKEGLKIHFVYQTKTPGIYNNTLNAFRQGKPDVLHYDSDESHRDARRKEALIGYPIKGDGTSRDEYPYASTLEGGKGAVVADVPVTEQSIQGGQLRGLYRTLQNGEAFLVLPVPRDNEPDAPPATGVNNNQNQNENQNNPGKVIQMDPAVKTGAKIATAAAVGYLLWKAVEFLGTLPVCGGCGVLSPI